MRGYPFMSQYTIFHFRILWISKYIDCFSPFNFRLVIDDVSVVCRIVSCVGLCAFPDKISICFAVSHNNAPIRSLITQSSDMGGQRTNDCIFVCIEYGGYRWANAKLSFSRGFVLVRNLCRSDVQMLYFSKYCSSWSSDYYVSYIFFIDNDLPLITIIFGFAFLVLVFSSFSCCFLFGCVFVYVC